MIKQTLINNLKFFWGSAVALVMAFLLHMNFLIPVFLITLVIYSHVARENANGANKTFLDCLFLFVILIALSYCMIFNGLPAYYIPFNIIPMLAMVLFNRLNLSFLLTLASAVAVAGIAGYDLNIAVMFLVSGILSSVLVKDARKRSAIIKAGLIVGIIQILLLFFIMHQYPLKLHTYGKVLLIALGSSVVVTGILPVFEYLFKVVTNISLLELADFNHPLMQRMILEAPGTYHHSLVVGNLSEAACQAVNAHALLARLGSYYHDIGKLSKPDYFSENQDFQRNKHDALSPTMSKLVIMNHVKEGVELAHKYRLNPVLTDFILQHHGTSLVFYFYRRALENKEGDENIQEEGFRYNSPKPNTKETAIVLLADSVEAATRTLREPTPSNIEQVVHKVINNKFIDGQLDECDLTLKDLEKISAVFVRVLSGIYHSRIIYPESSE